MLSKAVWTSLIYPFFSSVYYSSGTPTVSVFLCFPFFVSIIRSPHYVQLKTQKTNICFLFLINFLSRFEKFYWIKHKNSSLNIGICTKFKFYLKFILKILVSSRNYVIYNNCFDFSFSGKFILKKRTELNVNFHI